MNGKSESSHVPFTTNQYMVLADLDFMGFLLASPWWPMTWELNHSFRFISCIFQRNTACCNILLNYYIVIIYIYIFFFFSPHPWSSLSNWPNGINKKWCPRFFFHAINAMGLHLSLSAYFWYRIIYWLVVSTPLENMKVSWDDEIPDIWTNKTCSKPPARHLCNRR